MPSVRRLISLIAPLLTVAASGCSTLYSPGAREHFAVRSSAKEITDDDIRAAFRAHPQMPNRARVAYYTFEPSRSEAIETSLRALPQVEATYAIPSFLLSGHRRFDRDTSGGPSGERGLHELRLLAARAHCDLLVVFDSGWRAQRTPNALSVLNLLILPAFFTPFLDTRVEGYLDAYVIDVRNGYLYAQTVASREDRKRMVMPWASPEPRIADTQWVELLDRTKTALAKALAEHAGK